MGRVTGPLNSGKYQLIKPLATGGMGEIFLARMRGIEGFERLVVLKRLKPELAARAENIAMFLDEVRLLATIQHANVVRIYDVGSSSDGSFFYAMEYLHGQDLRGVMKTTKELGKIPLSLLVSAGASVLAGLHHVHDRAGPDGRPLRIVHRDVSPANIYVTYDGEVKLLDFGIALAASRKTQTEAGVVKGKFRYMSPEQCRTDPVDRRSDVFSLGIVLWEMATGKSLFKTDSDVRTLFSIVEQDAPSVLSLVPDFPPALDQIIMKALRRPTAERWQTAQQMQQALEDFALERKLSVSQSGVARFMEERFAADLLAWREAQTAGKDLGVFIAEQVEAKDKDPSGATRTPSSTSASGRPNAAEPPPEWRMTPPSWAPAAGRATPGHLALPPRPVTQPLNPAMNAFAPIDDTGVVHTRPPPRGVPRRLIAGVGGAAFLAVAGIGFALSGPAQKPALVGEPTALPVVAASPPPPRPPAPVPAELPAPAPVPAPAVVRPDPPAPSPQVARHPAGLSAKGVRRAPPRQPSADKPDKPEPAESGEKAAWDKDSPLPPQ